MGLQLSDTCGDSSSTKRYGFKVNQAHFALALRLQHIHQIGVAHGCERVVFHTALAQQHVSHKQMAFEHRSLVVGESGGRNGERAAQCVHQRFGDRADIAAHIAAVPAVKSGAVFEIYLLNLLFLQPSQGLKRLLHSISRRNGAGFQRHDHRIAIGGKWAGGNANGLHHPHTCAYQVVG